MKAFGIERYGTNDEVKQLEIPVPKLGARDLLIEVKAASVNPVDFKIRSGHIRQVTKLTFPLILGNDCAGIVKKVGAEVKKFKVGDEVFCRADSDRIGTFAELFAVHETAAALKPKNLSFTQAASLPLVGLTTMQAFERMKLKGGERVFIPAGSGGVGTFAIQLAKHRGLFVATTTSAKNKDFVKHLGADVVIDYASEDFSAKLSGYDAVFDTIGGDTQKKASKILISGGHLVSIIGPPTFEFAKEWNLSPLHQVGAFFMGMGAHRRAEKQGAQYIFLLMKPNGDQLEEICSLAESERIKPVIDKVFPFTQTKEALAYVETGRARGKVVIEM
jgi:NADPH:quinone reductase-like Zn-dependent oxidoreductase